LDDADADYEQAIIAYDRALEIWPGPIDWRTRARKANCLARTGQPEQAQVERSLSKKTQATLAAPLHDRVHKMLERLDRKSNLTEIVTFYRQLGRDREADCWEKEIAVFRGSDAADYAVPLEVPQR
jgi:tetratricopeptide (TPR) repeat protein